MANHKFKGREVTPRAPAGSGLAGRMAWVNCTQCGKREKIDTVQALNENSWPECCGELMEERSVANRKGKLI